MFQPRVVAARWHCGNAEIGVTGWRWRWARDTRSQDGGKGLSGSGAEHAQAHGCGTGAGFPAVLPRSGVFSSVLGGQISVTYENRPGGEGDSGFWIGVNHRHPSPATPQGQVPLWSVTRTQLGSGTHRDWMGDTVLEQNHCTPNPEPEEQAHAPGLFPPNPQLLPLQNPELG